jgi:hypothetical protein
MHTDETLEIFDRVTIQIGSEFRTFNNQTCPAFDTCELRREVNARKRRRLKRATSKKSSGIRCQSAMPNFAASEADEPLPKTLNVQKYTHHSLGDYPDMIRQFGTTDSFSTESVGVKQYQYRLALKSMCDRVSWSIVNQNLGINAPIAKVL